MKPQGEQPYREIVGISINRLATGEFRLVVRQRIGTRHYSAPSPTIPNVPDDAGWYRLGAAEAALGLPDSSPPGNAARRAGYIAVSTMLQER